MDVGMSATLPEWMVGEGEPSFPLLREADELEEPAGQFLGRRVDAPPLPSLLVEAMPEQPVTGLGRPQVVDYVVASVEGVCHFGELRHEAVPRGVVGGPGSTEPQVVPAHPDDDVPDSAPHTLRKLDMLEMCPRA
jgi:hypothetical protein